MGNAPDPPGKRALELDCSFAEEPVNVGGLGSGPSPYDFVSAGLAARTTMTVRLYAQCRSRA
ncbi:hypothetical protein FKV68_22045 (plasmid) [Sinorhizobium mexicanum]|uniref:Uncharacterized protein n=1 Tax=Sinorhizobium mexicanum TaxID=375549 RepID=A0A859QX86_9HYPH|nr:hypothetical protein FKV68_22045 [Sinorhizobium mexicanum]